MRSIAHLREDLRTVRLRTLLPETSDESEFLHRLRHEARHCCEHFDGQHVESAHLLLLGDLGHERAQAREQALRVACRDPQRQLR